MSRLHLATDDQLQFVGELLNVIARVQAAPTDSPVTTREWLSETVDALADLAACHDELGNFAIKLRTLAREEGAPGQEDTDGDSPLLRMPKRRRSVPLGDLGGEVVDQASKGETHGGTTGGEVARVRAS